MRAVSLTAGIAVLVCLALGASKGSASLIEEECGIAKHPSRIRRIVGGMDAKRFANPWMVLIMGERNMYGGGSLITSRFVLTSASCLTLEPKKVSLGEYDRNCTSEDCLSGRLVIDIEDEFIHPDYNMGRVSKNDIALLRLATNVAFSEYIRPICLRTDHQVGRKVQQLTATGWGRTQSSESSNILQTVLLTKIDLKHCNTRFHKELDASQLCAGGNYKDTCNGDSGGPLSARIPYRINGTKSKGSRRTFLLGIVSYGSSFCNGLGVYTNVNHFVKWIEETIRLSNIKSIQKGQNKTVSR
ncbi:CLIP domain-containing serine protease 14D-like [Drosophila eugracilis]|uniref:CLIP domain-containing serine protease 14D-like n=1 Tax=Drosophila eugracilis TaxID=29029 RepID=UPI0007E6DFBC|nr:CLIP domain-containing serine protease 14D-like [Drosophila eugracilis]